MFAAPVPAVPQTPAFLNLINAIFSSPAVTTVEAAPAVEVAAAPQEIANSLIRSMMSPMPAPLQQAQPQTATPLGCADSPNGSTKPPMAAPLTIASAPVRQEQMQIAA